MLHETLMKIQAQLEELQKRLTSLELKARNAALQPIVAPIDPMELELKIIAFVSEYWQTYKEPATGRALAQGIPARLRPAEGYTATIMRLDREGKIKSLKGHSGGATLLMPLDAYNNLRPQELAALSHNSKAAEKRSEVMKRAQGPSADELAAANEAAMKLFSGGSPNNGGNPTGGVL